MVKGKRVAELGCGAGTFLKNILDAEPELAVGVDLTEGGTEMANEMYGNLKNLRIIKQDIHKLEGYDRFFDIVIADQMLHHCPDTFTALKKAVSLMKPGGCIFFYVYLKKRDTREKADNFIRAVCLRMGVYFSIHLSEIFCWFGRFLTWLSLPFQRWLYWNLVKIFWNPEWSFDNCVRNIFDWYYVPIAHRHSPEEVRSWIRELKLEPESFQIIPSGISVRARVL